jgi:hypothetical protein
VIVSEEVEASVKIFSEVLSHYGVPAEKIEEFGGVAAPKHHEYRPCYDVARQKPQGGSMSVQQKPVPDPETTSLPENAYTPLKPGESYQPIVPANVTMPEVTGRSVFWGTLLCVIFTIASVYSGLKVGQVMEAAIPISILAIGLARAYSRRSTILENVIITGIGGVSGSVVAGAIFTLPALYILHLDPHPLQSTLICTAGGCLGVLFLIPLRRYFVRDMHGQLPYPEGTAITEVLVTGEKGGSQA